MPERERICRAEREGAVEPNRGATGIVVGAHPFSIVDRSRRGWSQEKCTSMTISDYASPHTPDQKGINCTCGYCYSGRDTLEKSVHDQLQVIPDSINPCKLIATPSSVLNRYDQVV